MIDKIIDEKKIFELIENHSEPSKEKVKEIFTKALELNGLDLEDVATLLNINNKELIQELFDTALKIKNEIYGNRLVLFAPLYLSNFCSNNCLYCGFRADNKEIFRRSLSIDEIKEETLEILRQGHKRVLMLMGENHKQSPFEYLLNSIDAVYSVRDEKGSNIRRINIEIAPLTVDEFKLLADVPIGTYTVFQETYHYDTYVKMHPSGKKADYNWRIETMDRALENGMHDVGIGSLFGLYDYKFEVLGLISHAKHLDEKYNVGPHTISIPRINPAKNAPASYNLEHKVSDDEFLKLVAILRLAVPYTGMILSTREPISLRSQLFNLGISQISAGSKTNPGGYKQAVDEMDFDSAQFSLNDCRSSGEIIQDVIRQGFVPSFCTACYRMGRVGADFMDLAKPGLIKCHCQPNALTTLKEYLEDYADDETRKMGEELIAKEIGLLPNNLVQKKTTDFLLKIEKGERDLFF